VMPGHTGVYDPICSSPTWEAWTTMPPCLMNVLQWIRANRKHRPRVPSRFARKKVAARWTQFASRTACTLYCAKNLLRGIMNCINIFLGNPRNFMLLFLDAHASSPPAPLLLVGATPPLLVFAPSSLPVGIPCVTIKRFG